MDRATPVQRVQRTPSGAIINLKVNEYRTEGWTSAEAAGLPIFPGLVRYEEVKKGEIDHAIRFTLNKSHVKPGVYLSGIA